MHAGFRPDLPLDIRRRFWETVKDKKCDGESGHCMNPVSEHITFRGAHRHYYCDSCYRLHVLGIIPGAKGGD